MTRGVLESVHAGFTGSGYVNTDNVVGAAVSWQPVTFQGAGAFRDGVIVAVAVLLALALLLVVVRAIATPLRILRNSAW